MATMNARVIQREMLEAELSGARRALEGGASEALLAYIAAIDDELAALAAERAAESAAAEARQRTHAAGQRLAAERLAAGVAP